MNQKHYIGQPVTALRDLGETWIKEGETRTVEGVHECPECGNVTLDVGVKVSDPCTVTCNGCGAIAIGEPGEPWKLNAYNFITADSGN